MGRIARRIHKMRSSAQRLLYARRMMHPALTHLLIGAPVWPVQMLPDPGHWPNDLLDRICGYYSWAHDKMAGTAPSMWDEHEDLRKTFIDALIHNDTDALRDHFASLFSDSLLDGMSHGNSLFADQRRNPYQEDFYPLRTLDCLLSLAEAVGVKAVPSYAQMKLPVYVDSLRPDFGALLAEIEDRMGFSLDMPPTGSPYVCEIGNGRWTAADILRHAYVAVRLRELGFSADSRILEIGGGFGMLALCANRAGYQDFTIVDLPFVGAIQMGYLGGALGAEKVAGGHEQPAAVNIVPPDTMAGVPDKSLDVVINCDSLPEIGRETAIEYMRQVRRTSRYFLSINQEAQKIHDGAAQNWVPDLVRQVGGFRKLSRFRHWMEQGYVEEVYECV